MKFSPGIGATSDLSLRVSVATLARVIFTHPLDGELMLALERKATLHKDKVEVKSQPFGGAIRILDLDAIYELIGDFHFDSVDSQIEQDFRLFIRPSSWPLLREFCVQRFSQAKDPILETDLSRELAEEFYDTLKVNLQPEQYVSKPVATVVENEAAPTENVHTEGVPTVRVYRIFEVIISDDALIHAVIQNSETISQDSLCALALDNFQNGGRGWANAVLTLPLKNISDHYLAMSPKERNNSIVFEKNQLDETTTAVLEGIAVPKYQKYIRQP